ncbi:YajG family lipoprotein [Thalassotalea castellviae]|uniref:YajG family lipoprotein n=1 Tax=Thalassotalea castellviae TaxID=3075612 RepID=A0ABU3A0G1_9GAMM|nr:YajG family lipoprotein [Thalassotalea sp. W431]MDT0603666.1 YajG family lipoprotein [Thalassotalea sp. W431]
MHTIAHIKAQLNKLAAGLTLVLLTACANTTNKMVIAPQTPVVKSNFHAMKTAQLTVTDMRANSHVVAIHREGKAIELIPAHDHLDTVLTPLLKQAFINSGLTINNNAMNSIALFINTAEVDVYQSLMKYHTTSQLTLTAKVSAKEQTLTKTFKNKGSSEGVLSADLAVLERNLNQQISDTIALIVNDSEIQQFLK